MNAAYLMLTTAWLAGADPVPATPAPAMTAPVVSAPIGGGCGGGCGCATDICCEKESLFSKLKNKFKKHDCGCESELRTRARRTGQAVLLLGPGPDLLPGRPGFLRLRLRGPAREAVGQAEGQVPQEQLWL